MINKIPIKYVIELGLIRKRDKCAKCGKEMDVIGYHIQLCKKCRTEELNRYAKKSLNKRRERIDKKEAIK